MIIGLGNPGIRYEWTRHNIGFQVVDRLASLNHITIGSRRYKTLYGKGSIGTQPVILAKPLTFMNLSGDSIRKIVDYFEVGMEDLIVVHDDLDLPVGRIRIKRRGGDGGHQGIRSIIESLGVNNFLRLKIGIGRPPKGKEAAEYVLEPLDETQRSEFEGILSPAAESLEVIILQGVDMAMNRIQRKSSPPSQSP